MKRADRLNYVAIAQALNVSKHACALACGVDDGFDQGFELSVGMTYDDLDAQWAYDVGTYIGACLGAREKETTT